jgi:OB-fold nucleic acid binding domain
MNINSLSGKSGSVYVRGVITSVKKKNRDGKKSAVVQLNDSTGTIGVYVGGDILEEHGDGLKSGNSFFCRASKNSGNDDTLFAKKLIVVEGENNG